MKNRESLFDKSKRDQAEQTKDTANIKAQNAVNKPKASTTETYIRGGILKVDKALKDAGV